MNRLAVLALPLLLAACATDIARQGDEHWLAGGWLMLGPGTEYPSSCNSHEPIIYDGDGGYSVYGEIGSWRLDGDQLTETATEIDEVMGDPEATEIGRRFVSRIERDGRDTFRKTFANGEMAIFRRCPPAE